MNLNNKGWGTLEMFLLTGGLLIALIVAIFFISKLYGSLELSTKNREYTDLIADLESAAREYVRDNSIIVNESIEINYNQLNNAGYISNFRDSSGSCDGYVKIINIDGIYQYYGKISCPDFKSNNY